MNKIVYNRIKAHDTHYTLFLFVIFMPVGLWIFPGKIVLMVDIKCLQNVLMCAEDWSIYSYMDGFATELPK